MRIIALEEHVSLPEMAARIPEQLSQQRGWPQRDGDDSPMKAVQDRLEEVGDERLRLMDESGITMQVLSATGAGADVLPPVAAIEFAKDYNDRLAEKIAAHPDRFAGFAHLPMTAPEAAADELERAVQEHRFPGALINGMTEGKFLDNAQFAPILARAEKLGVPLYLHPNVPPAAVREVYYDGLKPALSTQLGMAGWGWHSETAIHVLRLILSGTLERYPALQLIIGHMGEMLPVMMGRCDMVFKKEITGLSRTISESLQAQVYITTSGIFTQPPLHAAIETFGIDRILFSVDYPYAENRQGRSFLDAMSLSPMDMEKIAHGNADRLLRLIS